MRDDKSDGGIDHLEERVIENTRCFSSSSHSCNVLLVLEDTWIDGFEGVASRDNDTYSGDDDREDDDHVVEVLVDHIESLRGVGERAFMY